MACALIEDADQPGYEPSLIRAFAWVQWAAKNLSFLNADSEDSDQTADLSLRWGHMPFCSFCHALAPLSLADRVEIQSTLVISNSLISNNRLSRSENLVPVLIQRSTNRQQNIVEKRRNCSLGAISPLFHNIFNISLT